MPDARPGADQDVAAVERIVAARRSQPGAMLPILHDIQDRVGYIPGAAVPLIADGLNVSRAEVHGVISYYHDFRQEPTGAHRVQVCRAEACQARGSDALAAHAARALGCDFHHTTADGGVTLEAAYCLGHCSVGPNIAIDGKQYARVTPARFDKLVDAARSME